MNMSFYCFSKDVSSRVINLFFQAFAIFCGLGIHNCQLYEGVCKLMAKQKVAIECLSYHATAPQEETDKIKVNKSAAVLPGSVRSV